eukprot:769745_1
MDSIPITSHLLFITTTTTQSYDFERRSSYGSATAYLRANTTQPILRRSSYGSTRDIQSKSMSSHTVHMPPPRIPNNTKRTHWKSSSDQVLIESNTELATDDKIERVQQTISF